MLVSEFQTLTGFRPSWLLWSVISRVYNESQLDKHEWCAAYVANKDGMAGMIAMIADKEYEERERNHEIELKNAHGEIAHLREQLEKTKVQLDRELDWQPAKDIGTNMSEEEYAILAGDGTELNDLDAIRHIYEECGFDMARIHIVEKVCSYEANKHHKCRVSREYSRRPFWGSTDWNYIRFDVGNFQWELVNGELMPYCD
jgi:hypothetical protein